VRRRDFIKVISGSAVVWPLAARAQRSNVPHVGYLFPFTETASQQLWEACRLGLHELGYSEGHNIILVPRWAEEQYEKLPTLVSELLRLNVEVIVTASTPAALVAKSATKTTPIVFVAVADPRERRSCRDPRATRRECNRVEPFDIRFERQASSFAQGNCSQNVARCNSNESGQPIQRYFPGRNEACLSTVRCAYTRRY
jgi:ABC transporter substrate binding protein